MYKNNCDKNITASTAERSADITLLAHSTVLISRLSQHDCHNFVTIRIVVKVSMSLSPIVLNMLNIFFTFNSNYFRIKMTV